MFDQISPFPQSFPLARTTAQVRSRGASVDMTSYFPGVRCRSRSSQIRSQILTGGKCSCTDWLCYVLKQKPEQISAGCSQRATRTFLTTVVKDLRALCGVWKQPSNAGKEQERHNRVPRQGGFLKYLLLCKSLPLICSLLICPTKVVKWNQTCWWNNAHGMSTFHITVENSEDHLLCSKIQEFYLLPWQVRLKLKRIFAP